MMRWELYFSPRRRSPWWKPIAAKLHSRAQLHVPSSASCLYFITCSIWQQRQGWVFSLSSWVNRDEPAPEQTNVLPLTAGCHKDGPRPGVGWGLPSPATSSSSSTVASPLAFLALAICYSSGLKLADRWKFWKFDFNFEKSYLTSQLGCTLTIKSLNSEGPHFNGTLSVCPSFCELEQDSKHVNLVWADCRWTNQIFDRQVNQIFNCRLTNLIFDRQVN